ncbi:MAG: L-lactate dehydrogenase [Anaerolineaceae bacterium]|nr:L-lactate dehydrogenase [Anaerolineaceae bacterium]
MNNRIDHPVKIAIVGVGNVGATFAYALLGSGLASQIVLIDANKTRAEGEAMDLNHAVPLTHSTKIWAGDYPDCAGAAITVITAGTAQKPGETRLDLVQRNYSIYQSIIPQVVKVNPDGILLIASNPLDVLSYAAMKLSGLPANRVIGSGTILDTARFRYLLSQHAGVDPRSVHAYIIGEHGDSEVPVWSAANIAGMSLTEFCKMNCDSYDQSDYDEIFAQTRDAAYQIIERKGATFYGIGMGLVRICEAILRGQNTVLSVSTLIHDYYGIDDVYLSLPCVIGREGVQKFMRLPLDEKEVDGLQSSAKILKETLHSLGL